MMVNYFFPLIFTYFKVRIKGIDLSRLRSFVKDNNKICSTVFHRPKYITALHHFPAFVLGSLKNPLTFSARFFPPSQSGCWEFPLNYNFYADG